MGVSSALLSGHHRTLISIMAGQLVKLGLLVLLVTVTVDAQLFGRMRDRMLERIGAEQEEKESAENENDGGLFQRDWGRMNGMKRRMEEQEKKEEEESRESMRRTRGEAEDDSSSEEEAGGFFSKMKARMEKQDNEEEESRESNRRNKRQALFSRFRGQMEEQE